MVGRSGTITNWLGAILMISTTALAVPARADLFDEEADSQDVRKDAERRVEAAQKAIEGIEMLQLLFQEQQMQRGDCSAAVEIEGKAKTGDAQSQWFLADLYRQGLCVQVSKQQMAHWLQKAAGQEHIVATFELGLAYLSGDGVAADPQRAARLFGTAAGQGNNLAALNLI